MRHLVFLLTLLHLTDAAIAQSTPSKPREVIDFSTVQREYTRLNGTWNIYYESDMGRSDRKVADAATTKLQALVQELVELMPPHTRATYASMNYYLLWGVRSPLGGRDSGMRYIRRGEPSAANRHDPRWENSIVVYSADNLLYLNDLWSKKRWSMKWLMPGTY